MDFPCFPQGVLWTNHFDSKTLDENERITGAIPETLVSFVAMDTSKPSLSQHIGKKIVASIPVLGVNALGPLAVFTLHAVDSSGIWVENQKLTEITHKNLNVTTTPGTLVVFVPFSQIDYVFGAASVPAFSGKLLQ